MTQNLNFETDNQKKAWYTIFKKYSRKAGHVCGMNKRTYFSNLGQFGDKTQTAFKFKDFEENNQKNQKEHCVQIL